MNAVVINKALTLDEIKKELKKGNGEIIEIPKRIKKIRLNKNEFKEFVNNLLQDYKFLKNENIVEVTDGITSLIVDTQGYNYARYVGINLID